MDNTGKTISDKNDRIRSVKICRELAEKCGLHIARGKEKVKEHRLREPDKTKYEIYHAIKDAIPQCKNWNQLQYKLNRQGIEIRFKHKGQTDEIQGVVFIKNNYSFNGSKVDRMFCYSKIDTQLRGNNLSGTQIQKHEANVTKKEQSAGVIGSILDGLSGMSVFQPHGEDYEDNQFRKRLDYEEKKRQRKKKGIRR